MTTLETPDPRSAGGGPTHRRRRTPGRTATLDAFAVDPLKTTRPRRRPGQVDRPEPVARLLAAAGQPLVLVAAPTGYGKSTSVALWAEVETRPVAWLTVDELDNDPVSFLRHLVLALDGIEPIPDDLVQHLRRVSTPLHTVVLPRLGRALYERRVPFVVVIDDTHLMRSADTLACIRVVLDHLPAGSTLVLAGRSIPDLPLARRRLDGAVTELGPPELAMTAGEADTLMQTAGVELTTAELRSLHDQTEGWPAGLALAAMALTDGSSSGPSLADFGGDHRLVAEYLNEELLAGLDPTITDFLLRSSVLPRLSGPRCDEVLLTTGSGQILERLSRSRNLFVIPLDDTGDWYRLHHLFSDLMRAQLHRRDPAEERALHERASLSAQRHDDLDGAIRHAVGAGQIDRAAELLLNSALPLAGRGRNATVGVWLDLFAEEDVRRQPRLALAHALQQFGEGNVEELLYWIDVAEEASLGLDPERREAEVVPIAACRAMLCVPGIIHMTDFTTVVRAAGRDGNVWFGLATLLEGAAALLMGDLDRADGLLQEAETSTTAVPSVHAVVLAQQAYLAVHRDDWDRATRLIDRSRQVIDDHGLAEYVPMVPAFAIAALVRATAGDVAGARRDAQRTRHLLTVVGPTVPRTNLQVTTLLARTELVLGDRVAARTMAEEARHIAGREPSAALALGDLREIDAALQQIDPAAAGTHLAPGDLGPSSLTTAELRVLEHLPTHLSLKEIAEKLYVSRNTVKSQAISTYRKLGVSSRSEAVAEARGLGLIES